MRVVDTHLHFWDLQKLSYPWLDDPASSELRRNYLPEHWRRDASGLDVVATVHVQAEMAHDHDPVTETDWLVSLARETAADPVPSVIVGYADLRARDLEDVLTRHREHAQFRGIRQEAWFDPHSTRADVPRFNLLDDPTWIAGLRRLAAHDLSFDLLVWPRQLQQAAQIFRELPDLEVVLEHVGLPGEPADREDWRREMARFAQAVPHAMLKISALGFASSTWEPSDIGPLVREAIQIFGPDRCMFGSNFPVDRPAVSYRRLWQMFDEATADLVESERIALFCANAARAYRIDAPP